MVLSKPQQENSLGKSVMHELKAELLNVILTMINILIAEMIRLEVIDPLVLI